MTDATLLEQIEGFILQHQMPPSRFGLDALGDGALITQLRAGRSLTLRNAERVSRFIAEYEPTRPAKVA